MFYKISNEEFQSLPTCYSLAYQIVDGFHVQLFDDAEPKEHWIPVTKEDFEANRPADIQTKTDEQNKIEQLEMDNAILLMSQAETESRLAQAEADHATLLMELAMKGVI